MRFTRLCNCNSSYSLVSRRCHYCRKRLPCTDETCNSRRLNRRCNDNSDRLPLLDDKFHYCHNRLWNRCFSHKIGRCSFGDTCKRSPQSSLTQCICRCSCKCPACIWAPSAICLSHNACPNSFCSTNI